MAVLDPEDCLRRLGRNGIGRIAVTVGALPAIFPIGYAIHEGCVYFRTAAGTKLAAASSGTVVAFEVDHVDPIAHRGWSVVIVGPAAIVDSSSDGLERLPIPKWVSGGPEHLVRVSPVLVSGREIGHPAAEADRPGHVPFDSCPDCGSDAFHFVSDGEATNVVCTGCFACWRPELGYLSRVAVDTCPGRTLEPPCHAAAAPTKADENWKTPCAPSK